MLRAHGKQNGGRGGVGDNKQILTSPVAASADNVKREKMAAGQCRKEVVCPLVCPFCSNKLKVCYTKDAILAKQVLMFVCIYVTLEYICMWVCTQKQYEYA